MNTHAKQLWLDALRGEDYPQAREALRTNEGYCPLGVLCDLHSKETNTAVWLRGVDFEGTITYEYLNHENYLPLEVQQWAGLSNNNPYVAAHRSDCGGIHNLSDLNDRGSTFGEIADLIEAQL